MIFWQLVIYLEVQDSV